MSFVFWQHLGTDNIRVIVHVTGVIDLRRDALEVEWQASKVEHLRASPIWTKGDIERRVIPFSLIESITYKPRWLSAGEFGIRARNLTVVQGLPGVIGPIWVVRVAKTEKSKVRELVSETELRLANHRLIELESGGRE